MNVLKTRALVLLSAVAIAGTACQGEKGPTGTNGTDGTNATPSKGLSSSGLQVAVKSATVNPDQTVSVNFTVKDDQGNPVDLAGNYSTNVAFTPRFSLSKVNVASDGTMLPYSVLTKTGTATYAPGATPPDISAATLNPTAVAPANPAIPATTGVLVENGTGAGDYTYKFATGGYADAPGTGSNASKTVRTFANAVNVDPKATDTYVVWIEAARQMNTTWTDDASQFKAVNVAQYFVPAGGTPVKRELVTADACNACHRGFRPEGTVSSAFHGGTRVNGTYCAVCHNVDRVSTKTVSDNTTPAAASSIFIHRIHASEELYRDTASTALTRGYQGSTSCTAAKPCTCTVANPCIPDSFHGINDVKYPQNIGKCDTCHGKAAQGAQAKAQPSRAACGSCHSYAVFDPNATAGLLLCTDPAWVFGSGPCVHGQGASVVNTGDDTACKGCHAEGGSGFIGDRHQPLAFPTAGNIWQLQTSGTATAGYIAPSATMQDCSVTACTCSAAAPCFDPNTQKGVTANQATGKLYVGVTACGTGHQPYTTAPIPPCTTCSATTPCLGSGNNNTNAAFVAAAGVVPPGISKFTYVVQSVSRNSSKQPVIVFKLQKDGVDAPFDNCANLTPPVGTGPEIYNGYVGAPSVYFVWAMPQDGVLKPADFNMSANAYLKSVCNVASANYSITYDAPSGFYTVTLKNQTVADNAVMLTGGIGYTYGLTSTPPLVQIDIPAATKAVMPYFTAYDPVTKQGGLSVASPDVWKVGTGYTGRRVLVDNAKCNACHGQLGVAPTFHAGQRNDGPTCAWCHKPNQTSGGWSANAKDFIHALHAAPVRTNAFNWHASAPGQNYGDVTFPGRVSDCEACHVPGGYDFSVFGSAAPNMLPSTVGTGKYNNDDNTVNFTYSPFILAAGISNDASYAADVGYGSGWATSGTVNYGQQYVYASGSTTTVACTVSAPCTCTVSAPCDANPTTLVVSPVTAACAACHDDPAALSHMKQNGATFYGTRAQFAANAEQCLICHGPTSVAPIADVHR
jgi:OmcA/MtrC family decaheme c-type cytochrome